MEELRRRESCYGQVESTWREELLKEYPIWFLDATHQVPPYVPICLIVEWGQYMDYSFQYGAEMLSIPSSKGLIWRIKDGMAYVTAIEVRDPEERAQREKVFRERTAPLLENYDQMWKESVQEVQQLLKPFKEADVWKLSDFELKLLFQKALDMDRRVLEIHSYWMAFCFNIYNLFEIMCEELLDINYDDPLFKKLMSGHDNLLYQANREILRLGVRARELGLADLFLKTEDNEEVLKGLEQSDAGRRWLEEYREFLKVHGWRSERFLDWTGPCWVEQPSLGIRDIRWGIAKGEASHAKDEAMGRLVKEREEAEREILARVPLEQKDWFEKLMRVAQFSQTWNEEHNYYIDIAYAPLIGMVLREIGRRFARAGMIDDPLDVFMLLPEEILRAIPSMERIDLRPFAKARREEWEGYTKKVLTEGPVPFLGDPGHIPELLRAEGILATTARVQNVRPELKADLYGAASAPGVTEGIARVLMSAAELKYIQPGEVLVTVCTEANWTPAFNIISSVVTDTGADLCHALLVGREYGIPAVVGTLEATRKIKTGDRVRVDGNLGAVWILEKA